MSDNHISTSANSIDDPWNIILLCGEFKVSP